MSDSNEPIEIHTDKRRPSLKGPLIGLGLLVVIGLGIVAATLSLTSPAEVENLSSSGDAADIDRQADVSQSEALRIHALLEDEVWADPPYSQEVSGHVVDASQYTIAIERDAEVHEWPLAGDVKIWKSGVLIAAEHLNSGDDITIHLQQLGSRQDGWMNAIVKVNVDAASARPIAVTDERKFVGEVVNVGGISITLRNRYTDEGAFPVKTTALVTRDGETGGLSIVKVGDQVALFGRRVGSRSDGWTTVIHRITVTEFSDE